MSSTEKLSVAALISVILRRKINRTIDVKWLIENEAYATEIIKLCREQHQDDLTEHANHLEVLMFVKATSQPIEIPKAKPDFESTYVGLETTEESSEDEQEEDGGMIDPNKYIGRLR